LHGNANANNQRAQAACNNKSSWVKNVNTPVNKLEKDTSSLTVLPGFDKQHKFSDRAI
jgi:hypothetical protein